MEHGWEDPPDAPAIPLDFASEEEEESLAQALGVQWFYQNGKIWEPFDSVANEALEQAHKAGDNQVPFGDNNFPAILPERIQKNLESGQERKILRGTWFFQRTDGSLQPFPEDTAGRLELSFPSDSELQEIEGIDVGEQRVIYRALEGDYAQVRKDNKTVRWVTVQYMPGKLPLRFLTPRIPKDESERLVPFHWWREGVKGVWEPYTLRESQRLEAERNSGSQSVRLIERNLSISLATMEEVSEQGMKKLLRSVWHWQAGSGALQPYSEESNRDLEEEFVTKFEERSRDAALRTYVLGVKDSIKTESFVVAEHQFLRPPPPATFVWEYLRVELLRAAGLQSQREETNGSVSTDTRIASLLRVLQGIVGGLARDHSAEAKYESLAPGRRAFFVKCETAQGLTNLSRYLAFLICRAGPVPAHASLGDFQRHRRRVEATLSQYGMQTDGPVDQEQRLAIQILDESLKFLRSLVEAKTSPNESEFREIGAEGPEGWEPVKIDEQRVVSPGVDGGFVQFRPPKGRCRKVLRGYQERLANDSDLKAAKHAPKPDPSTIPIPESKTEDKAAEAEKLLLSGGGPGRTALLTHKLTINSRTTINYVKVGGYGPALLLLHGSGIGLATWAFNFSQLSEKFTVYALDLPQHGRSSKENMEEEEEEAEREAKGGLKWSAAERYLVGAVEGWRSQMVESGEELEYLHVAGHGFGAYVAFAYAVTHPSRVHNVLLAEPWGMGESSPKEMMAKLSIEVERTLSPATGLSADHSTEELKSSAPKGLIEFCTKFVAAIPPSKRKDFGSDKGAGSEVMMEYLKQCSHPGGKNMSQAAEALAEGNGMSAVRPIITRIKQSPNCLPKHMRMTILLGQDTCLDASAAIKASKLQPNKIFVALIPKAGHQLQVDNPSAFNEALSTRLLITEKLSS